MNACTGGADQNNAPDEKKDRTDEQGLCDQNRVVQQEELVMFRRNTQQLRLLAWSL